MSKFWINVVNLSTIYGKVIPSLTAIHSLGVFGEGWIDLGELSRVQLQEPQVSLFVCLLVQIRRFPSMMMTHSPSEEIRHDPLSNLFRLTVCCWVHRVDRVDDFETLLSPIIEFPEQSDRFLFRAPVVLPRPYFSEEQIFLCS